ncbi:MAG: TonB-dependent receptor [Sphingobacteriales bacterium]|nr:MAG: TonB-dependent receptor [Sphingobacteriales bacterium]
MRNFFIILSLLLNIDTSAQNIFKGKIIDEQSKEPVEAAVISVVESNKNIITDKEGNFSIVLPDESATAFISSIGYSSKNITLFKAELNIISLQRGAVSLKEITLVSSGNSNSIFKTISKIDLDIRPVKNSQELMRLVPGLFVAQHAGGGKAEQIFLRGFDADHGTDVQVSVDGLPVNMVSHAHGQGYADSHFIIPETVNNIDFGTGPYYAAHGNLNTAGYVSFSTFNSIDKSRVQIEAGRFNTFRTLAVIDLLKNNKAKQSAYIAGEFNYTDGPTINKQHFNRINLFGKYNLALTDKTKLSFSTSAFSSKWDASGQVPTRAVQSGMIDRFGSIDPSEGGNTERYNANLIINHNFHEGMNWENQVYYTHYQFNLFSDFTFFLNDPVNGDEINQKEGRNVWGYLSKLTAKKNFNEWNITSTYAAGVRYDATQNTTLAHVVKREFLKNITLGDIKETNAYAFIDKQLVNHKWSIGFGIRADYFNNYYLNKLSIEQLPSRNKTIISPKLNIQYTINKATQLYVKAGKGFHSNDTRVVVQNNGRDILPAAYGTDLGIVLKPTNKLLLNVAAWYLFLQQEFVYVGDEGVIEPSGKTRRMGIDIIGRYQFNDHLFANVNINLTRARSIDNPKGENYIPLAPTFTSVGGLFYKSKQGFNGGINYRLLKDRPANENNTVTAKGYFVVDAVLNYTKPKYEIGFSVENLFNTKWNEAQFDTESRLKNELSPVRELHFTPGVPFFPRVKMAVFF